MIYRERRDPEDIIIRFSYRATYTYGDAAVGGVEEEWLWTSGDEETYLKSQRYEPILPWEFLR